MSFYECTKCGGIPGITGCRTDAPVIDPKDARIKQLEQDNTALLHLLAHIREAVGDNGKRMQDELVTYIRDEWQGHLSHIDMLKATLKAERAEADAMRDVLARIAKYPRTRSDEMGIDTARRIAAAALLERP